MFSLSENEKFTLSDTGFAIYRNKDTNKSINFGGTFWISNNANTSNNNIGNKIGFYTNEKYKNDK